MTDQTIAPSPQPSDQPAASPLLTASQSRPARTLSVPVWLVAGLTGFAAGAAAVGLAWGLSSDSSSAPAGASTNTETFTLVGSMTLTSGAVDTKSGCAGSSGYSDIRTGAGVTVYDESGKVLAIGALGPGMTQGVDGCAFTVNVAKVPKGSKFYQVEISHRGKINLSSNDAEAGLFGATLG
ncbi:hypothetical protein ACFVT9_04850 [Kitasatospora cineracea]|uniref:hypothetical protein n=1 Tax=Kitasatospora cineracea TaxID=88074 RepID=UPI0036DBE26D